MFSRVEAYTHNVSPNTCGGALVRILVQTDFASRTDELIAFAKRLAREAYIHGESNFGLLCKAEPELQAEYDALKVKLGEKVEIRNIAVFLSPDKTEEREKAGNPASALFE